MILNVQIALLKNKQKTSLKDAIKIFFFVQSCNDQTQTRQPIAALWTLRHQSQAAKQQSAALLDETFFNL